MKLYDAIIRETLEEAELSGVKRFAAAGTRPWPDEGKSELVMLRDAAFELGGSGSRRRTIRW